jgi:hypothetical protein
MTQYKCRVQHPFDHYVVGRLQPSKQDDYETGPDEEDEALLDEKIVERVC